MSKTRIVVRIEEELLARVDVLVTRQIFSSRDDAIEQAIAEKIDRVKRTRLAEECAKLDPAFERSMAGNGRSESMAG